MKSVYAAVGLGSMVISLAIIGILYVQQMKTTVTNPEGEEVPLVKQVDETYNFAAQAAGNAALNAQRLKMAIDGEYAKSLDELRAIDKSVASDPEIVFVIGEPTDKGFAFTTSHVKGDRTYVFR